MTETIRIEIDARGVAQLVLARVDKHNAMSAKMMDELHQAAIDLGQNEAVRVVVLAADGPTFCAGGDLEWMREQMGADRETRMAEARRLAMMLMALDRMPKPLIGRIHGNAFGGGVGLASVCDCAIGAENILMGLTEVRLGLIPATIGPYVIARMGAAKARQVFFQGRRFDAGEAEGLGLLARRVPSENLDAEVAREVESYLSAAPGAVARAKALVHALDGRADSAAVETSIKALADAWETAEAAEGIDAFFSRRKPGWLAE
ncbi:MAG: crotonase/enoyl-CoA hydratase family protein [Pseudomonadota bacterium]|nr:crotonase/enoyl-CoA hydratase family protein [Pseudomonadota bacterium]MEE3072285.1 crotonase/enoyl-CoA hydratase family protein [Pseudomonadota bacterium]